jgi:tetratricopeptide (TPR) repeat protein
MPPNSQKTRAAAPKAKRQKDASSVATWKHLDASEVQRYAKLFEDWKLVVERRTEGQKLFLTPQRKWIWQRTLRPSKAMRCKTWRNLADRLVAEVEAEWNSSLKNGEIKLVLTSQVFLMGPPSEVMQPGAGADLQETPSVSSSSVHHLFGYVDDLRTRIDQAQLLGHVTAERSLRHTLVETLGSLGAWLVAARELDYLIEINEKFHDYDYVAQALLDKGVALYRAEQFDDAGKVLAQASDVLCKKLPPNAALRTEIAVWDYLGLCYVRLGRAKEAVDIFLDKKHSARARKLGVLSVDASRSVRLGIAYLALNRRPEAKAAFIYGIKLRVEIGAAAEAARALRYLGLFYAQENQPACAICIWDLALRLQRAFADETERAKLHFYWASIFQQLSEDSSVAAIDMIACAYSESLFPDDVERNLLIRLSELFRDDCRTYTRRDFVPAAHFGYQRCIELGTARNLTKWLKEAQTAKARLPEFPTALVRR